MGGRRLQRGARIRARRHAHRQDSSSGNVRESLFRWRQEKPALHGRQPVALRRLRGCPGRPDALTAGCCLPEVQPVGGGKVSKHYWKRRRRGTSPACGKIRFGLVARAVLAPRTLRRGEPKKRSAYFPLSRAVARRFLKRPNEEFSSEGSFSLYVHQFHLS